jgi:hypothetical protein
MVCTNELVIMTRGYMPLHVFCCGALQRITPLGAGRGLYQPSPHSVQPLGSAASVRSAATASPANR